MPAQSSHSTSDHPHNESAIHALVVDDDKGLRELLQEYLQAAGITVTTAADGNGMRAALSRSAFDIIILDVMLPDTDGLSLARELRPQQDVPIIMLSARGDTVDRIVGLEVGADDYIPKPFDPRELLARIRAILRRQQDTISRGEAQTFRFGHHCLDMDTRSLKNNDNRIHLTTSEYNLLTLFIQHPNRVLSRDFILQNLKGYEHTPYDRSIDIQVTRLRQKIEDNPSNPRHIKTVRGAGYLFTPEAS